MIHEKSCGAVIYTDSGGRRLFLVELMRKGHSSLCKGHVEENETEHETAAREIREETGLSVAFVNGFRETIEYSPDPGCKKTGVFFLAESESTGVKAQEEEVREIRWLPFEEAAAAMTFDSDREVLTKAEAFLNENRWTAVKIRYDNANKRRFKAGFGWKACLDEESGVCTAQRSWRGFYQLCEIDRNNYEILGTEAMGSESADEWIAKGRVLFESDDDYYTPPWYSVFDENYMKLAPWSDAQRRADRINEFKKN